MKVLKFGGTSVGTIESLKSVNKIVEGIHEPVVVVVSALGGITDKLIATAHKAASGDPAWKEEMKGIRGRHLDIVTALVPERKQSDVSHRINAFLIDLQSVFEGLSLIRDLSEKTLSIIVSYGERLSSYIISHIIPGADLFDSLSFIKTEKWFSKNIADQSLTESLIKKTFDTDFKVAVAPGFISTDKNTGEITNLGRGGSDFTAALIASALDAEILEIWTDVDGFMTADPRIVSEARVIPTMSFIESMELCTYGAKIIYPPTIYPVFHKNIPIRLLNTFNPDATGTLISDNVSESILKIKGVSSLPGMALINLVISDKAVGENVKRRALNSLSKSGMKIFPVSNPDPAAEFSFAVKDSDFEIAIAAIEKEFAPEISHGQIQKPSFKNDIAALAVVGDNLREKTRLAARIGHSLRREGINVEAVSFENSQTTFIFMVAEHKYKKALQVIHELVF